MWLGMERIRLRFTRDLEVGFVDRERALRRIEEWAGRGTRFVQVIYGPEGCGKSAWLRQSAVLLKELGFEVLYVNPMEREFMIEVGIDDVKRRFLGILRDATNDAWVRAVWVLIDLARELIKAGKRRILEGVGV